MHVLYIVAGILCTILILLALVLLAPIRVRARFNAVGLTAWGRGEVSALWGLVRVRSGLEFFPNDERPLRVHLPDFAQRWTFAGKAVKPKKNQSGRAKPSMNISAVLAALSDSVSVDVFHVRAEMGIIGDAAATAMVCGGVTLLLGPLEGILRSHNPRAEVSARCYPRFESGGFTGSVRAEAHIIPVVLFLHWVKRCKKRPAQRVAPAR